MDNEVEDHNGPLYHLIIPTTKLQSLAEQWLQEDCPSFDAAAICVGDREVTSTLYAKSPLTLAGIPFFTSVFERLPPCSVEFYFKEGEQIPDASSKNKIILGKVKGPANLLLRGERPALNILAECCSIAAAATKATSLSQNNVIVAGTRKTTPGIRLVQKYGMIVGGMDAHRYDLSSMVMIKDNHIQACNGNVQKAINSVKKLSGFSLKIDVECEDEDQAIAACKAGADIIMLDNFEVPELERVAKMVKQNFPGVIIEASGGINFSTLSSYCLSCIDVVSFSVNKYAEPVDISLKIDSL